MLDATATFALAIGLWFAFSGAALSIDSLVRACVTGALAALAAWRLGALGGCGRMLLRAPRIATLAAQRSAAIVKGGIGVAAMALSRRMRMRPGLARVRAPTTDARARALFAQLAGAAPGTIVVEADASGLLLHALDEEGLDAAGLSTLNGAIEGRAPVQDHKRGAAFDPGDHATF